MVTMQKHGNGRENANRSIVDQKCPICGCWMTSRQGKSERGRSIITYSCPDCGLTYSADG